MTIRTKSLKNGFTIPVLGKGNWMTNIGRKPHPSLRDGVRIDEIKKAIDTGITFLDTAERYGNGYGEILIGKAIKGYHREKLFISSKVSSDHVAYEQVINCAKASIKRLQSSYLDLYSIHQFTTDTDVQKTMQACDYLIEQKLINYIGVCNFTVAQLEKAQSFTQNKIVANQLHYNLMYTVPDTSGIIDYCQKQDIMLITWRPFEQNLLTPPTRKLLDELANKYTLTPSQIALIWLTAQTNIVALAKLNTNNSLKAAIEALTVECSTQDLEKLTQARK